MKILGLMALVVATLVMPTRAQDTFTPDAEGFIRDWLVLAPLPMTGQAGAEEVNIDLLKGEANVRPKANDPLSFAGTPLTWKAHHTADYFIDFRESFDKAGGEYVSGYAVAYVIAEAPMSVTLALGTNDQGKAWLNGKEVFKNEEARVLEKDTDKIPVSLVQGQNVLVLKVVNEVNSWQACARFLNGTTPVKSLTIALAPR